MRGFLATRPVDRAVAALAERQRGVVSRGQLLELGLSDDAIDRRLVAGRLHRLHAGVYAVGHRALAAGAREQAALLACGPLSALSHCSAAAWSGLIGSWQGPVDVIPAVAAGRRQDGIAARRCALRPEDVDVRDGLRCTTVARTLIDLAATNPALLDRVLTRAEMLRLDVGPVYDLLAAGPRRRGAPALRAALARCHPEAAHTRSELERRFLALVVRAALPVPALNALVEAGERTYLVDALWIRQRVVVELDGRRPHDTARGFEDDRRRTNDLLLAGYLVLRFTWQAVTGDPGAVLAAIQTALATHA